MGLVDVIKFASNMGPTCSFLNPAILIKMMETSVRIRLQNPREAAQMLLGMFSAMIGRVGKPHCRWRGVMGRTVITHIGPEASGLCLALPRSQHWYGRIIGVKFVGCHHMP